VRRGRAPDSFEPVAEELGGGAFLSVEDVERRLEATA
jgi:hypothetical protein